jgi:hypothetical protein
MAVAMLLKSQELGRYSSNYQQFETVRKLHTGYSNMDCLQLVQSSNPAAIPPDVDMFEQFGLFLGPTARSG